MQCLFLHILPFLQAIWNLLEFADFPWSFIISKDFPASRRCLVSKGILFLVWKSFQFQRMFIIKRANRQMCTKTCLELTLSCLKEVNIRSIRCLGHILRYTLGKGNINLKRPRKWPGIGRERKYLSSFVTKNCPIS